MASRQYYVYNVVNRTHVAQHIGVPMYRDESISVETDCFFVLLCGTPRNDGEEKACHAVTKGLSPWNKNNRKAYHQGD
jgi:hypothetical protein